MKTKLIFLVITVFIVSFLFSVLAKEVNVNLTLDYKANGPLVKKLLFGNNIEWVDNGEGVFDPASGSFNSRKLAFAKESGMTSLRFPGGCLADTYHWKDGIGDIVQRRPGLHFFNGNKIASNFGTFEFLQLCKMLGASPIITLNIATGTPQEAVEWVLYVNKIVSEKGVPAVLFWEVGNEPYYGNKFAKFTPDSYAAKFLEFAVALKKVNPDIVLGANLVSKNVDDFYRNSTGKGWNETVLKQAGAYIDYVSLHNAYYPGPIKSSGLSDKEIFRMAFDGVEEFKNDIDWLTRQLSHYKNGAVKKIAITEYNSFFGLNSKYDSYISTLGGALYVAGILHNFITDGRVDVGNFWSLFDNWYFGMVSAGTVFRPGFYVFKFFAQAQDAQIMPVIQSEQSQIKVLAVKDTKMHKVSIFIINFDTDNKAAVNIRIDNFTYPATAVLKYISGSSFTDSNDYSPGSISVVQKNVVCTKEGIKITVNPVSVSVIECISG